MNHLADYANYIISIETLEFIIITIYFNQINWNNSFALYLSALIELKYNFSEYRQTAKKKFPFNFSNEMQIPNAIAIATTTTTKKTVSRKVTACSRTPLKTVSMNGFPAQTALFPFHPRERESEGKTPLKSRAFKIPFHFINYIISIK